MEILKIVGENKDARERKLGVRHVSTGDVSANAVMEPFSVKMGGRITGGTQNRLCREDPQVSSPAPR